MSCRSTARYQCRAMHSDALPAARATRNVPECRTQAGHSRMPAHTYVSARARMTKTTSANAYASARSLPLQQRPARVAH
jgi:hypothetical protein